MRLGRYIHIARSVMLVITLTMAFAFVINDGRISQGLAVAMMLTSSVVLALQVVKHTAKSRRRKSKKGRR